MGFEVLLRNEATEDIDQAIEWYESKSTGLGKRFLTSVEETVSKIIQHPNYYSYIHKPVRRCAIATFPYSVHYIRKGNTIVILGVIHRKRSNAFKRKRQK